MVEKIIFEKGERRSVYGNIGASPLFSLYV